MTARNTRRSYGSVAKFFHWTTAILILSLIPLGQYATWQADIIADAAGTPDQARITRTAFLFSLHKTLGLTVFLVALLRILWAFSQPRPALLNGDKPAEAILAELVHWLLYGALVLVPLSGWIHHAATTGFAPIWWPFGQSLPFVPKDEGVAHLAGTAHWALQWVLTVSVALHVAGALKHHVIDGDATLRRMLPGRISAEPSAQQPGHALPVLGALSIWAAVLGWTLLSGAGADHAESEKISPEEAVAEQSSPSETPSEGQGNWSVEDGTLGLTIVQMGSDISGAFTDWRADITYDDTPDADGKHGTVTVTTVIGSLTLGSVTDQAKGPAYLDASQFPEALFEADLLDTGEGMVARGTLTLKGQSMPAELPFTLTIDGDTAQATGDMVIDRMAYGIGTDVSDEGSLKHAVTLRVDLTAVRAK